MRPVTLALDREGTIIADALSCYARPGVRSFLEWAGQAFERVVVYTAVPERISCQVLEILVEDGEAPSWFAVARLYSPVERAGKQVKDLDVLGPRGAAVIVDDDARYILEEQKACWVNVMQFTPHDSCESDRELERVRHELEKLFR